MFMTGQSVFIEILSILSLSPLSPGEEIKRYAFGQEDGAKRKTKVSFLFLFFIANGSFWPAVA